MQKSGQKTRVVDKERKEAREQIPRVKWNIAKGSLTASGAVVTRRLSFASATVAAAAFDSLGSDSVAGSTEWGNLSALFPTYRVIAIRFWISANAAAAGEGYWLLCTYRNGTVPASVATTLWSCERPVLLDAGSTQKLVQSYEARVTGDGEAEWISTTGPTNQPVGAFGIKWYNGSSGGGASRWCEMLVQFRSLG